MAQPLPAEPSPTAPRRRVPPADLSAVIRAAKEQPDRGIRVIDAAARVVITLGGIGIIASVLAIVVFVAREFLPLWAGARGGLEARLERPAGLPQVLAAGVEEYRTLAFLVSEAGTVEVWDLGNGQKKAELPVPGLDGARVTAASIGPRLELALGTADGRLLGMRVDVKISYAAGGERTLDASLGEAETFEVDPRRHPVTRALYRRADDARSVAAASTGPRSLVTLVAARKKKSLLDEDGGWTVERTELSGELPADLSALAIEWDGESIVAGTASGETLRWDLRGDGPALSARFRAAAPGTAVTALDFLIGDQSIVVGDAAGHISTWMPVRDPAAEDGWTTKRIHAFAPHRAAVTAISPSRRDKGFVTAAADGMVGLHHATSEQTLLRFADLRAPVRSLFFAPRADGVLGLTPDGTVASWWIHNPHPEATWKTLFGKVWYEGYAEPAYVWQSTGGTDDFEPKFSLVPLVFGTLKGTVYALLFAVPLATLAALYTSQFAHPSIRNVVKPVIEIMAGLPSVVVGFLAGLYLAPLIQKVIVSVFLLPVVLPLMTVVAMACWERLLPRHFRARLKPGAELALILLFVLAGVLVSWWLGPIAEARLFGGDFEQWLLQTTGTRYDQRNSLVVGLAMGFAVIPIIFTISEDSLSSVPAHLVSASLALGASRWQTATRVVLPTASPGIFSAIMVGFGRAIGETMIVLMATGNTPVMDWSLFNGFRALSANIAVEIPEAPHGGTLYRVLFLAGGLLFAVTFLVNTAAELIRQRLRQRYARL